MTDNRSLTEFLAHPTVRRVSAAAAGVVAAFACLSAGPAGASQAGNLDAEFNANVAGIGLGDTYVLIPLRDGGYVFTDDLAGRNPVTTLRKIDVAGNEVTSYSANVGSFKYVKGVQVADDGIVTFKGMEMIKLDADGNEVAAFRDNTGGTEIFVQRSGIIQAMVATPDGGVVIGGTQTEDGNRFRPVFLKLNSSGVQDASFRANVSSAFTGGGISFMSQFPDGSLLVASGSGDEFEGGLKKFSAAGIEDTVFTTNVSDTLNGYTTTALDVLPNGTAIVAVTDEQSENFLFEFDATGREITTWDEAAGAIDDTIEYLAHTAHNHVLFGSFSILRELDANGDAVDSFVSSIPSSYTDDITGLYVTLGGDLLVTGQYEPTVMKKYFMSEPAPTVSSVAPATGPMAGGTSITITGTNFAAGAALGVSVGGIAATSVRVVSATKITAKTPAHAAGVANIVVTNGDGQTATLSRAFTFTAPVAPPPVTVLSGAAAKSAKVVTVASKVSGDFRAAPSIGIVVGVGVAPVVKGLPANSSIKVDTSATFENRPTSDYQTIGTVRCDAKGALKIPAFKPSRVGSLNIRFTTSAGKHYYLKVQVTAR